MLVLSEPIELLRLPVDRRSVVVKLLELLRLFCSSVLPAEGLRLLEPVLLRFVNPEFAPMELEPKVLPELLGVKLVPTKLLPPLTPRLLLPVKVLLPVRELLKEPLDESTRKRSSSMTCYLTYKIWIL